MLVKTPSGDHYLAYAVCDPEIRLKKKKNLNHDWTIGTWAMCHEPQIGLY